MTGAWLAVLLGQEPTTSTTTTTTTTTTIPMSEQKADDLLRQLYQLRSAMVQQAPDAYQGLIERRALPSQTGQPTVPPPDEEPADTGCPWWDALAL